MTPSAMGDMNDARTVFYKLFLFHIHRLCPWWDLDNEHKRAGEGGEGEMCGQLYRCTVSFRVKDCPKCTSRRMDVSSIALHRTLVRSTASISSICKNANSVSRHFRRRRDLLRYFQVIFGRYIEVQCLP